MAKSQTVATSKVAANKKAAVVAKAKPVAMQAQHDHPIITEEQRHGERRQREAEKSMQFAAQQMSTPQVPVLEAPQVDTKQKEFNDAVAALAKQFGVAPEVVAQNLQVPQPKAPRILREAQNGITRPGANTKCGKIWGMCDAISSKTGAPATIAELKAQPAMADINDHTMKTQYARWRAFNNITGRLAQPAAQPLTAPLAVQQKSAPFWPGAALV